MRLDPLWSANDFALFVHMSCEGLGAIAGETGLRQHLNAGGVGDVIFSEHAPP